jgi:hypothetical protein
MNLFTLVMVNLFTLVILKMNKNRNGYNNRIITTVNIDISDT